MTHNCIWEFSFKKYWYNELSKNMEQRMKWKWILLYSPLMPSTSYQLPPLSTTHMLIHAVHPKNSDLTIIHYPNLQQRKTNRRATKWKNQVFVLADFWTNIFSTTSCCLCPTLPPGPRMQVWDVQLWEILLHSVSTTLQASTKLSYNNVLPLTYLLPFGTYYQHRCLSQEASLGSLQCFILYCKTLFIFSLIRPNSLRIKNLCKF